MIGRGGAGCAAALLVLAPLHAAAQPAPDPAAVIAVQRRAMATIAALDGVWRGTARTLLPSGEWRTLTQTERIGPFLEGSVKVIEGRAYEGDGRVGFNALGVVSYNPDTHAYTMRSYAQGKVGDFSFTPTPEGFVSKLAAGGVTVSYTATIKGGSFREVGERTAPGAKPVRIFEMELVRVGDTDWPAAGAVPQK